MRLSRRLNRDDDDGALAKTVSRDYCDRRAGIIKAGGKNLFERLESLDRAFGIPVGWLSSEMTDSDWTYLLRLRDARERLLRPGDDADEQTLLRPVETHQSSDSISLLRVPKNGGR